MTAERAEELLTISEAARRYGVAKSTVSRWVEQKLIASIILPSGLPRVYASELEIWIGPPIEQHPPKPG